MWDYEFLGRFIPCMDYFETLNKKLQVTSCGLSGFIGLLELVGLLGLLGLQVKRQTPLRVAGYGLRVGDKKLFDCFGDIKGLSLTQLGEHR